MGSFSPLLWVLLHQLINSSCIPNTHCIHSLYTIFGANRWRKWIEQQPLHTELPGMSITSKKSWLDTYWVLTWHLTPPTFTQIDFFKSMTSFPPSWNGHTQNNKKGWNGYTTSIRVFNTYHKLCNQHDSRFHQVRLPTSLIARAGRNLPYMASSMYWTSSIWCDKISKVISDGCILELLYVITITVGTYLSISARYTWSRLAASNTPCGMLMKCLLTWLLNCRLWCSPPELLFSQEFEVCCFWVSVELELLLWTKESLLINGFLISM